MKLFAKEARRYGVLYCALKGIRKNPDGMVDVMVRAEDASKIDRIVERFELAAVDKASIRDEIAKGKKEKAIQTEKPESSRQQGEMDAPGLTEEESRQAENFLDELMGTEKADREKPESENPGQKKAEKGKPQKKTLGERQGQTNARLSGPISTKQRSSGRTSSVDRKGERRSVRAELEEIRQSREQTGKAKAEAEKSQRKKQEQKPGQKAVMHQQPKPGKRRRKGKER